MSTREMTTEEYFAHIRERQRMLRRKHITEEPIWETQGNRKSIPLSKIEDSHLQEIDRMLRGEGRPWPDRFRIASFWYEIIETEMRRRGLKPLPRLQGVDPVLDSLEEWLELEAQSGFDGPYYRKEDGS